MPVLIIIPVAVATVVHNVLEKPARATIRKKVVEASVAAEPKDGLPQSAKTPELVEKACMSTGLSIGIEQVR